MFCSKCGKEMDNTNSFCPHCGHPVSKTQPAATYEPVQIPDVYHQSVPEGMPVSVPNKSKKGLILAIVLPCAAVFTIIVILIASLIIKGNEKAQLQEKLLRDWSRVESSDGSYYTLRLDFDDDEIEYIFDGSYIDKTIKTYEYEIVSGDTIRVEGYGKVKVEFNKDETMMTFTPSLTDKKASENWFNFD